MLPSELEEYLASTPRKQLREYVDHLNSPNADRALILVAHSIVERMLGDMISPRLSHPEAWLEDADFRARTNLARAMNLIGDDGLAACRVLNRARNEAAHRLEPLAEKWRLELDRVAVRRDVAQLTLDPFEETLRGVIAKVAGPWLYSRVQQDRRKLIDSNEQEWRDLMAERIAALDDPVQALLNEELTRTLVREVDDLLAKRLKAAESSTGGA